MRLPFPSPTYIRTYVRTHTRTQPTVSIDELNLSPCLAHQYLYLLHVSLQRSSVSDSSSPRWAYFISLLGGVHLWSSCPCGCSHSCCTMEANQLYRGGCCIFIINTSEMQGIVGRAWASWCCIYSWAIGLCNIMHGHQKRVAEEGLGEQQKLIIVLKFHKVHVINHKWAHKKITQTLWYMKLLQL